MGAGGEVDVAAGAGAGAGGGPVVVVAEDIWIKPFDCSFDGCTDYYENGASLKYIQSHMEMHKILRASSRKKEAARKAERDRVFRAAGPSAARNLNRRNDTPAEQRSGKNNNKKKKKKKACKGSKAKGKAKQGKQAGAAVFREAVRVLHYTQGGGGGGTH